MSLVQHRFSPNRCNNVLGMPKARCVLRSRLNQSIIKSPLTCASPREQRNYLSNTEADVRRHLKNILLGSAGLLSLAALVLGQGNGVPPGQTLDGKRLFEDATFGGNGRTCETCHSGQTSTMSPEDAQKLFKKNPNDVLFIHDGSDDGLGGGTTRIRKDATILVTIPLPANVSIAGSNARSVILRRGIPTLQNTPALDPVLMLDGRQPTLEEQAAGAIHDHAQGARPSADDLHAIAEYEKTNEFYSSPEVRRFALGGPAPELPAGNTASEKRGRRFFEDVPPNPADGFKPGLCAHCHSGPLLNQTNEFAKDFIGLPIPKGQRFISVNVSEFNDLGNPVRTFIFDKGTPFEFHCVQPGSRSLPDHRSQWRRRLDSSTTIRQLSS